MRRFKITHEAPFKRPDDWNDSPAGDPILKAPVIRDTKVRQEMFKNCISNASNVSDPSGKA